MLQAWDWQHHLVERSIASAGQGHAGDSVLLLQHLPVYTLGSGSTTDNLRFDPAASTIPLYRTERGGEVTYHGPGQVNHAAGLGSADAHGAVVAQHLVVGAAACCKACAFLLDWADAPSNLTALPPRGHLSRTSKSRAPACHQHHPAQLVMYPILNLQRQPHRQDLHWYLRSLEEVVIVALREAAGLEAERVPGLTGVWVDGHKLAAIGVRAKK